MFDRITEQLLPHFKPAMLQRAHTVFQFRFDNEPAFHLTVTNEKFEFSEGDATDPTLTLYVHDRQTCWDLLTGREDGMKAFVEGRYRADGNIVLSQLLLYLFKSDNPAIAYEVKD